MSSWICWEIDIDGLSLVAERRQNFNDASKEYIARHQQEVEH
jgi:hypothetical protein